MGHLKGLLSRDSQPRVRMTAGRGVSEKSNKITWRSKWTPHFWKFSRKSFWAFPSWNQTWRGGIGSEEEESEPWRGFWPGMDLRALGVIAQSIQEREMRREKTHHNRNKERKRHMHEKCMNMWRAKFKYIMGKTQSNPTSTHSNNNQTHILMHETLLKCNKNTMHEHITSNQKHPTQQFHKNLKNPKNFKNPKS